MKKGEKGDLTKFSNEFWQTVVAYGGTDDRIIRNHKILTDRRNGLSYSQIAIKHNISRWSAIQICKQLK